MHAQGEGHGQSEVILPQARELLEVAGKPGRDSSLGPSEGAWPC